MKYLFVGGPGRSGTSLFAQQLVEHPHVVGFFDVEMKIYSEVDGLIDLYNSYCANFSPNRAEMGIRRLQFRFDALFEDAADQVSLGRYVNKAEVVDLIAVLAKRLGHPHNLRRLDEAAYFAAARAFSFSLAEIALRQPDRSGAEIFLEKTPHVLLHLPFLKKLHPDASYIHVMRDPRAVAHSLMRMPWGPSRLDDCIAWVAGYWSAYRETRHWASVNHVRVQEFLIEEVAAAPEHATRLVCDELGVPRVENLFRWGNLTRLNAWVDAAPPDDIRRLDAGLSDLAHEIGYRRDAAGVVAR